MIKLDSNALIKQLILETEKVIEISNKNFASLEPQQLFWKPDTDQWSVANCLDHLNKFAEFYHPLIERKIDIAEQKGMNPNPLYVSGWLGDYFVKTMKPDLIEGVKNKMKTSAKFDPSSEEKTDQSLFTFLEHQTKLSELIHRSSNVDISRIKIPIAVSKIVGLKLGDTFRFLIAHNQRHIIQAQTVVSENGFPE